MKRNGEQLYYPQSGTEGCRAATIHNVPDPLCILVRCVTIFYQRGNGINISCNMACRFCGNCSGTRHDRSSYCFSFFSKGQKKKENAFDLSDTHSRNSKLCRQ